ncbi:MAG: 4'-phosphopantetheinyl transferase superfamily protein [Desulfuromonadaceae bacterium]|nr:4'-phosphopantetheinyl transferase superfamily protein [Desulfuromonadaceae bacterium]MDD2848347.1 4'-phosphopantetheinyl transferase superfamily protein [Desulfuromonadaceae bacterium]MDD4129257.1 4'-phosphopantetheinyl transferase superfamily protein [Desulfuromonadaceae bacterium]
MTSLPQPRDGEIHVFCIDLTRQLPELSRFTQLLSPDETARATRLKIDSVKKLYTAGRGILRIILGAYLGVEPGRVMIATGEHGKPYLADAAKGIRFNLSHSRDVLVLAVSSALEVGIDIESIDADKPLQEMAKLAFSHHDQHYLLSLPTPQRYITSFYRCWVRTEACLKASGRGFSPLDASIAPSSFSEEKDLLTVCCNQTNWHILDLPVPPGYCAALAVEAGIPPQIVRVSEESLKALL